MVSQPVKVPVNPAMAANRDWRAKSLMLSTQILVMPPWAPHLAQGRGWSGGSHGGRKDAALACGDSESSGSCRESGLARSSPASGGDSCPSSCSLPLLRCMIYALAHPFPEAPS